LSAGSVADVAEREFKEILRDRRLFSVFQPIVHLATGATAGYEALVRGPRGSRFTDATTLLAYAYRTGSVVEFDWAARASACRAALAAPLRDDQLLFLNAEPLAMGSECPADLWPDVERAFAAFQVVLEVTERSLARDPRSLLDGIARQRPTVAGLAVDDLGATTPALSMLPVLASDVIKLDLTITQAGPSPEATKILDIAYEEAERTGAVILAEGIENPTHAAFAESVGAALGQGWHYGEPDELRPAMRRSDPIAFHVGSAAVPDLPTPFDALEGWSIGRANDQLLVPLAHQVVYREVPLSEPGLVLVLVPEARWLPAADREELGAIAQRGVVAGALGSDLTAPPAVGVRTAPTHDPRLDGQWAALALSPSTATAMLARARPGTGGLYDFGVTHDRGRVVAAARCLLRRLGPE
jgi:EAL domain-containing protein (putative c-di-GMP-specific phosphodiesterase class I)